MAQTDVYGILESDFAASELSQYRRSNVCTAQVYENLGKEFRTRKLDAFRKISQVIIAREKITLEKAELERRLAQHNIQLLGMKQSVQEADEAEELPPLPVLL
jgi:hypothetical protein